MCCVVGWVFAVYVALNKNACCGVGCLLFFLFYMLFVVCCFVGWVMAVFVSFCVFVCCVFLPFDVCVVLLVGYWLFMLL